MSRADPQRLVFIDEAGSHVGMTRLRGRSPSGERCPGKAPRNRGTVTTMIGSLRADGISSMMTIEGGTSGEVFLAYVNDVLGPTLRPGDVVVLDNLGAHRTRAAIDAIHAFGARVKFLPPYSPDLNPIEMAWSKLKEWLRAAKARSVDALDDALRGAIEAVTPSDAAGWFGACGYHRPV